MGRNYTPHSLFIRHWEPLLTGTHTEVDGMFLKNITAAPISVQAKGLDDSVAKTLILLPGWNFELVTEVVVTADDTIVKGF